MTWYREMRRRWVKFTSVKNYMPASPIHINTMTTMNTLTHVGCPVDGSPVLLIKRINVGSSWQQQLHHLTHRIRLTRSWCVVASVSVCVGVKKDWPLHVHWRQRGAGQCVPPDQIRWHCLATGPKPQHSVPPYCQLLHGAASASSCREHSHPHCALVTLPQHPE